MAAILSHRCDPKMGFFCLYKDRRFLRIKLNPEGTVFDMPLHSVYRMRDVVRVIRYYAECMNLSIVSENLTIDLDNLQMTEIAGNNSIAEIMTLGGPIFIKKINCISPGFNMINCLQDGYGVLANMHGFIRLTGDRDFKFGVLMEKCFPVVKIDIPMIIRALDGLFKLHRSNNGVIHGDCNPSNIMSDKYGQWVEIRRQQKFLKKL